MPSAFWDNPLFWICMALSGFIGAIAIFCVPDLKNRFLKIPEVFRRIILLLFFLAPLFVLPLTPQPRLSLPISIAMVFGGSLLTVSVTVRMLALKQIGVAPGLRDRGGLVETDIYGIIRHPIYLSNILFLVGWALILRATYALLFTPILAIGYLVFSLFEEKRLEEEFGEEYEEYRRKVLWRLIPRLL